MKIGFIISCHNKVDDLMVHLEILKYYPFDKEIIICHSMDYEDKYMNEISKYHHKKIESNNFHVGTLLCLLEGMKLAKTLKLDYIVYNNCDDWCFNYKFVQDNFSIMSDYKAGGYNWFSVNTYDDFAMNHLYLHVPSFNNLDKVDFLNSRFAKEFKQKFMSPSGEILCEFKLSKWIMDNIEENEFYRIPNRERNPGIGHDRSALAYIYNKMLNMPIPESILFGYNDNNRWFNLEWQMICSHSNITRYGMWQYIKPNVSFAKKIEKDRYFKKWLKVSSTGGDWNIKIKQPPKKEFKKLISRRKVF